MSHCEIKCFLKRHHSGKQCEWGNFSLNQLCLESSSNVWRSSVCNSLLQGRHLVCISDSVNYSEVIHLHKGTSYEISKMGIKKMPKPESFHWLSRASRRSTVLLGDAGRLRCLSVPPYSWIEPAKTCFSCYESYRFQKDNLKQSLHVTWTFVSRWWLISLVYLTYLCWRSLNWRIASIQLACMAFSWLVISVREYSPCG